MVPFFATRLGNSLQIFLLLKRHRILLRYLYLLHAQAQLCLKIYSIICFSQRAVLNPISIPTTESNDQNNTLPADGSSNKEQEDDFTDEDTKFDDNYTNVAGENLDNRPSAEEKNTKPKSLENPISEGDGKKKESKPTNNDNSSLSKPETENEEPTREDSKKSIDDDKIENENAPKSFKKPRIEGERGTKQSKPAHISNYSSSKKPDEENTALTTEASTKPPEKPVSEIEKKTVVPKPLDSSLSKAEAINKEPTEESFKKSEYNDNETKQGSSDSEKPIVESQKTKAVDEDSSSSNKTVAKNEEPLGEATKKSENYDEKKHEPKSSEEPITQIEQGKAKSKPADENVPFILQPGVKNEKGAPKFDSNSEDKDEKPTDRNSPDETTKLNDDKNSTSNVTLKGLEKSASEEGQNPLIKEKSEIQQQTEPETKTSKEVRGDEFSPTNSSSDAASKSKSEQESENERNDASPAEDKSTEKSNKNRKFENNKPAEAEEKSGEEPLPEPADHGDNTSSSSIDPKSTTKDKSGPNEHSKNENKISENVDGTQNKVDDVPSKMPVREKPNSSDDEEQELRKTNDEPSASKPTPKESTDEEQKPKAPVEKSHEGKNDPIADNSPTPGARNKNVPLQTDETKQEDVSLSVKEKLKSKSDKSDDDEEADNEEGREKSQNDEEPSTSFKVPNKADRSDQNKFENISEDMNSNNQSAEKTPDSNAVTDNELEIEDQSGNEIEDANEKNRKSKKLTGKPDEKDKEIEGKVEEEEKGGNDKKEKEKESDKVRNATADSSAKKSPEKLKSLTNDEPKMKDSSGKKIKDEKEKNNKSGKLSGIADEKDNERGDDDERERKKEEKDNDEEEEKDKEKEKKGSNKVINGTANKAAKKSKGKLNSEITDQKRPEDKIISKFPPKKPEPKSPGNNLSSANESPAQDDDDVEEDENRERNENESDAESEAFDENEAAADDSEKNFLDLDGVEPERPSNKKKIEETVDDEVGRTEKKLSHKKIVSNSAKRGNVSSDVNKDNAADSDEEMNLEVENGHEEIRNDGFGDYESSELPKRNLKPSNERTNEEPSTTFRGKSEKRKTFDLDSDDEELGLSFPQRRQRRIAPVRKRRKEFAEFDSDDESDFEKRSKRRKRFNLDFDVEGSDLPTSRRRRKRSEARRQRPEGIEDFDSDKEDDFEHNGVDYQRMTPRREPPDFRNTSRSSRQSALENQDPYCNVLLDLFSLPALGLGRKKNKLGEKIPKNRRPNNFFLSDLTSPLKSDSTTDQLNDDALDVDNEPQDLKKRFQKSTRQSNHRAKRFTSDSKKIRRGRKKSAL